MAYSTNPNLPKARAFALKLLMLEQRPLQVVANQCGVHRTTIWRWLCKWQKLNENRQLTNDNRPTRPVGQAHLRQCQWLIATEASRPLVSPTALSSEIVNVVLAARNKLQRCAEVVWHHLTTVLGVTISLSSVRRILRRLTTALTELESHE